METEKSFSWFAVFFLLLVVSHSTSISDVLLHSFTSTGRNLLQAKKACPVNFEFQNYTIITSQCKGPHYPLDRCCSAFKEFACPYEEQINDLTSDCASIMFSNINLHGQYPPGLFASECREGKEGLACPASPPSTSENASGCQLICNPSVLLMATTGFVVFLLVLL
ncbi:GPI-anchored protein LLG1-like [Durio zibethinus]|uniref:GPI-anchored protein LLG1-like n=1 Tax=Durio zibethinus TaxID=66656 RepID=A0A6P5ZJ99_DURZI|nr:GPI-anchored protein LLG1-like [Durio zibethinus]